MDERASQVQLEQIPQPGGVAHREGLVEPRLPANPRQAGLVEGHVAAVSRLGDGQDRVARGELKEREGEEAGAEDHQRRAEESVDEKSRHDADPRD